MLPKSIVQIKIKRKLKDSSMKRKCTILGCVRVHELDLL